MGAKTKKKAAPKKKAPARTKKAGGEDIEIYPAQKTAAQRKRHEKRDIARTLFLSGNRTAKDIADALDVSEVSISKWRTEDSWDSQKAIFETSPAELIKQFTEDIILLRESFVDNQGKRRAPTTKETDQIKKLTKCIKEMRNQLDPQTIMEALDGFMAYLAQVELPLSKAMAPHAVAYVDLRQKESKQK